ncbi:MAG: paraquat-inducible protein A [Syntrophobacteraceae bacterium]
MTLPVSNLKACPDCDLLQRVPALPPGGTARCIRCGRRLAVDRPGSLERTLALAVAAAIALVLSNLTPLLGLSAVGRTASTTILGGAWRMWVEGQPITAFIVAFCTVIAPGVYLGFMLVVLPALRLSPAPPWAGRLLRWSAMYQPWAMVEVMMLGVLVALIKIADLATVVPGIAMFSVGALVLLFAAMSANFAPQEIWDRIKWVNEGAPSPEIDKQGSKEWPALVSGALTGLCAGLVNCEVCGLLSRTADFDHPGRCRRCGSELEVRKHNSVQKTWALIIAAAICYIPANLYPVMVYNTFGNAEEDTIIDGVILLYKTGSWHLALIVLIASVVIPLAKLASLAYLLTTVQRRSGQSRRERIRLYRMVEFIGRWSMLDVFVVAFTVALIQLQPLMVVQPGMGVVFFAAVVVLTMIAAETFDSRLIWDVEHGKEVRHDE